MKTSAIIVSALIGSAAAAVRRGNWSPDTDTGGGWAPTQSEGGWAPTQSEGGW
ncbi:hypothetical protein Sste5344_009829, partial [Sporothrix stenoceras]